MGKKSIDNIKLLIDTPLEQWTNGQLKFEVASQLNEPSYIMMLDYEKEDRKYPVTREEMISYLRKGAWK